MEKKAADEIETEFIKGSRKCRGLNTYNYHTGMYLT